MLRIAAPKSQAPSILRLNQPSSEPVWEIPKTIRLTLLRLGGYHGAKLRINIKFNMISRGSSSVLNCSPSMPRGVSQSDDRWMKKIPVGVADTVSRLATFTFANIALFSIRGKSCNDAWWLVSCYCFMQPSVSKYMCLCTGTIFKRTELASIYRNSSY